MTVWPRGKKHTGWLHRAHEFIMTGSWVPTQQKVCSMRGRETAKQDPTPPFSLREKLRGDSESRPPPVPAQGLESNSDKMLDVQQPPFLICGADLDEKVASGRSRPLWRGFIRYYNLSFLQGQGQRWLLFAPYFMARKIFDPRRLHLVHMEVLCRNGFCGTQCSTARIASKWEVNKDCVKHRFLILYKVTSISSLKPDVTSLFFFRFEDGNMWQSCEYPGPGYQWVCCLCTVLLSVIMQV